MPPQDTATDSRFISLYLPTLALVISFAALAFTGLQWRDAHNQLLLAMKPSINFTLADDPNDPTYGISIQNAGPGAAKIRYQTWFIDHQPVGNSAKPVADLKNFAHYSYNDLEPDDTLAVNQTYWLLLYNQKQSSPKERAQFVDYLDNHIAVEVEFCSVMGGQCVKKCSTKGMCAK